MSYIAAGVAAAGLAINVGTNIAKNVKSKKAAKELAKQPTQEFSVSPEQRYAYDLAKQNSQFGYTEGQKADFKQGVAQQQNTAFQQGVQMSGGNLAQALRAGLAGQNLQAQNQFAANDAAIQQQKIGQLYQQTAGLTDQYNMIQQNRINRQNMLAQAYGQARQDTSANIQTGIQQAGAIGGQAAAIKQAGGYENIYGTKELK